MRHGTISMKRGLVASLILGFGLMLSACGSSDTVEKGDRGTGSSAKGDSTEAQGELVESGFGRDGQYVYPVSLVKNTADHAGQTVIVSWNLLDSTGEIVKSDSHTESFNFPGQTIVVTTQVDVGKGVEVASIEPTLLIKDEGFFKETEVDFGAADAQVKDNEYGGWSVSFPVKNPTSKPLESPRIGIACRDAEGKINGGGIAFPDLVPPNGQIKVDANVNVSGKPASCKAYVAGPVF